MRERVKLSEEGVREKEEQVRAQLAERDEREKELKENLSVLQQ